MIVGKVDSTVFHHTTSFFTALAGGGEYPAIFPMKEYAKSFYTGETWIRCRKAYAKSVGGLCERCLAKGLYTPGKVVHHKIHLTPENISDPDIALGWENLELLCMDCHAYRHREKKRWQFEDGQLKIE